MATILYADGRQEEREPANGTNFELAELQAIVGGYIEIIPTKDGRIMVCNEESKLLDLPRNAQATALARLHTPASVAQEMLAAHEQGVEVIVDPALLEEADYISGDVLLCRDNEVR